MFFDGACSRESIGAGVVFVSPSKEKIHLSFKLDFKVTNNITEYEALVLGLNVAKDMNIQGLKVYGDVDLIIQQIKNTFQAKHVKLKEYRDEVWNLIDSFLAFNISLIPRAMNQLVDSLAISASTLNPPLLEKLNYEIQVKYRPSLLDNVKFWKVFEDDEELVRFLEVIDDFSTLHIDHENENVEKVKNPKLKNKIGGHDIIQLPNNKIPRGLVPLEKIFDQNDVPLNTDKKEEDPNVFKYNLGDEQCPKTINLSTQLTAKQRFDYGSLMKEFSDIFSWEYSDLKTYDTQVIAHKIHLKK
jgi:ribonuclease HI